MKNGQPSFAIHYSDSMGVMTKEEALEVAAAFVSEQVDINHFDLDKVEVRCLAPQPSISPDRMNSVWAVIFPVRKQEGVLSRSRSLVVHVDNVTGTAKFLGPP